MGSSIFKKNKTKQKTNYKENNISLESVKNWWCHHEANQNYINVKVFIGLLYNMKVLFSRSSEQKLYLNMIRQ